MILSECEVIITNLLGIVKRKLTASDLFLCGKMQKLQCKYCQHEIAANAKTCPNCGAKNNKPLFKKWWFWLVIVIVVAEYGEKFTEEAQYAVDTLQADYNANALEKAKSYRDTMDMSPAAIYDQLISEYGEQFTAEEAQWAIDHLD